MPYLICDKCNSSYDFRVDEENIFCNRYDCGNTLKYYDSLEEYHQEKRITPDNDFFKYQHTINKLILNTVNESPIPLNLTKIIGILQGSKSEDIIRLNLNNLYSYGFLSDFSYKELYNFVIELIRDDYLHIKYDLGNILVLTSKGLKLINNTEKENISQDRLKKPNPEYDEELYEKLRKLRNDLAREKNVSPYIICRNESLQEMAKLMPQNDISMMPIKWLGIKFIEKYGLEFQDLIKVYVNGKKEGLEPQEINSDDFPVDKKDPAYQLLNSPHGPQRSHAAYILGETRDNQYVDVLCQATLDKDGNVRRMAASALKKIGDPCAEDALIRLLNDEKPQVRQYAIKALGKLGSQKSLPYLNDLIGDDKPYNRNGAQTAIARIKSREED